MKGDLIMGVDDFFNSIVKSKTVKVIGGIILISVITVSAIAGFGFLAGLGITMLVGLITIVGNLGRLVKAIIVASIFSLLSTELLQLIYICDFPKAIELFTYLVNISLFKLTMLIFLIIFSLHYFTNSIRILNIDNSSSSEITKKEVKEKETETEEE